MRSGDVARIRAVLLETDARANLGDTTLTVSLSQEKLVARLGIGRADACDRLEMTSPLTIRKRGQETRLIVGDSALRQPDPKLVRLLEDASTWLRLLIDGEVRSVRALADHVGRDHRAVARTLPLAYLAPDIAAATREGTQPSEITPTALMRIARLPLDWRAQRQTLGFEEPA